LNRNPASIFVMIECPSCGSSRVRSDYRPAPWFLRPLLIRALLCDYCNRQFRSFSWRRPSTRQGRDGGRPADLFLRRKERAGLDEEGQDCLPDHQDQKLLLTILRASEETTEPILPGKNLRHEIAIREVERQEQPSGGAVSEFPPPREMTASLKEVAVDRPVSFSCPSCGSGRVRRRPRTKVERLIFSLTHHRAYQCRECQSSFYRRGSARGDSSPPSEFEEVD
jgi:predicted RNA-binding Zn-ribbon protein involved in translation (DUF1610 family)